MSLMSRDYALSAPDPALSTLFFVRMPQDLANTPQFLLAESVSLLVPKISAESSFSNGGYDFFPGFIENDSVSITFYETYNYAVSKWLRDWRKKVSDGRGNYGLPVEYKKDIIVAMYSKFSTKPVNVVTYNACWPTDRAPYELNYQEESGRVTVQATFSCDNVFD